MPQPVGGRLPWSKGCAVSEPDRDVTVARRLTIYVCPRGHEFELPFAVGAEAPGEWDCRRHGTRAARLAPMTTPPPAKRDPHKTPWDHLLERRTIPELEANLAAALRTLEHERNEAAAKANDPRI